MWNKILKISVLSLGLLALTSCSAKQGDTNEKTEEVTPTTQVQENEAIKEENNVPEGDYAENVIIALDAGHGGGYTGASYDGKIEKDLTLQVATYVKDYLEANYTGMEVYLVRDTDAALSSDVAMDLEMRAEYAKNVNADSLVSLHFNASENHSQEGAMVLISHRETVTQASQDLANSILDELENLGLKNKGTVTRNSNDMFDENGNPLDYYAINRHCAKRDIPGIIVEHCFMDHERDQEIIKDDAALKELAKADAIGIANYYGLPNK